MKLDNGETILPGCDDVEDIEEDKAVVRSRLAREGGVDGNECLYM
jgi:hypothetical protein